MKKVILALCGLMMTSTAMATDFNLSLSEHSATFGIDQNLGLDFKTSFSGMYHEDNGSMMDFGFMATNTAGQLNME